MAGPGVYIHRAAAADAGLPADAAALHAWVGSVLASERSTELKHDGRSRLARVDHDTGAWVVKRVDQPQPVLATYHAVRMTPAWREHRAAERLHAAGVRIVRPVALVHHRRGQTTIMPFVEAHALQHQIESLADADARLRIAVAVGRAAGRITAAGLINRDHKPMNLLIDPACREQGEDPVLIDVLLRRRSDRRVAQMFNTLIRAALRTGNVSVRERMACLRAAIAQDPTLSPGGRAAALARRIAAVYIPADQWPT